MDSPQKKLSVAEATFQFPDLYKKLVNWKRVLYQDALIGISEFTRDKEVLDVGCGPSLAFAHLEYQKEDIRSLTAMDVSLPFVTAARNENPGDKFRFAVGSIETIPFRDKAFDTSIVSFVIHHVNRNPAELLREIARVTRSHIIIFDHVQSDRAIPSSIQRLYWKLFDGGCQYLHPGEWEQSLGGYRLAKSIRTGLIFNHVVKYVLEVPGASS